MLQWKQHPSAFGHVHVLMARQFSLCSTWAVRIERLPFRSLSLRVCTLVGRIRDCKAGGGAQEVTFRSGATRARTPPCASPPSPHSARTHRRLDTARTFWHSLDVEQAPPPPKP